MKKAVTAILSIILLIGFFAAGFYSVVHYSLEKIHVQMENKHRQQTIAENVHITSDWIEIKPAKPLETTKIAQEIQVLIEGYKHEIRKNDFGTIQIEVGAYIKPQSRNRRRKWKDLST